MGKIKFRYKFDSTAYVVDEKYFLEIERMAKINGEKIEKLAEKKFRAYLNNGMNPIKLEFKIRGVDELIGHSVVSELNYSERWRTELLFVTTPTRKHWKPEFRKR